MSVIISNHARRKSENEFSNLNVKKVFETVVNCSKEEITSLKNTPSYKRMKASDKKNVFYKKTPSEDVYFVCTSKTQKTGERKSIVITLIDLKKEDPSFISSEFLIESKKRVFELKEISKQLPSSKKSKKRKGMLRPNYEGVKDESCLFEGQKILLTKLKNFNDTSELNYKFKLSDFNLKDHTSSRNLLKAINHLVERKKGLKKIEKKLDEEFSEIKNIESKKLKKIRMDIYSMLSSILVNVAIIENGKPKIELDCFTVKKASSGLRTEVYNLFADVLFSMVSCLNKIGFVFKTTQTSEKIYKNLEMTLFAFSEFKNKNDKLDEALSLFAEKLLPYDKKKMLDFIEVVNKESEILYLRPIESEVEKLNLKLTLTKKSETKVDIKKMKDFYNIFINKMKDLNTIKLSLYHF